MNDSIEFERDTEDMGSVKTQTEQNVAVEDHATPVSDAPVAESPFGSATTVIEEEAVRNLAPILDLPEAETAPVMAEEEPEVLTPDPAPTEEYEIPRMAEPEVVAAAPVEVAEEASAEPSIYEDPMFGPIKRLLIELVGEA